MKYATGFALVAGAASALAQSGPIVTSPPSLVTCLPASITASGGQGPYYITVLPGGQPGATPLADLGETDGQLTWNVNLPAGTSITIQVRDQRGMLNYSAQSTIQAGSSTACIGQNASVSGATTQASTPAASSTGAVSSAAQSSAAPTTSAPQSGSTASRPTSAAPSSATSSRPAGAANMVRPAAGALALVGAAAYLVL